MVSLHDAVVADVSAQARDEQIDLILRPSAESTFLFRHILSLIYYEIYFVSCYCVIYSFAAASSSPPFFTMIWSIMP
ncbi:hypothetical protein EVA_11418 [gut metagenome]|uniref:Uncharacterized protein n=1 Tax=gut metagenome TaxID=749906 RepID=J9FZQ0_9ZZZZ